MAPSGADRKSWNGVAILARGGDPIVTRTELPGDPDDAQARYIEAAVNGVLITSLYAPNGNPQPGPKFNYKLAWMDRLAAHAADLFAAGVPVVLAGDFNVVPTDRDIYPTKSYDQGRAAAAGKPRALSRTSRPGLERRDSHAPSRRADVHLLELHAEPLAARRRAAHRSSAAEPGAAQAACRGRRRSRVCAARKTPATMRRPGSSCAKRRRLREGTAQLDTRLRANERNNQTHSPTDAGRNAETNESKPTRRPLLVIDGDSFAHRAYHALPKNIRRKGDRPAGAILGFANLLLRLYREEQPRAVLVGWDTYEEPTYRHEAFRRLSERPRIR